MMHGGGLKRLDETNTARPVFSSASYVKLLVNLDGFYKVTKKNCYPENVKCYSQNVTQKLPMSVTFRQKWLIMTQSWKGQIAVMRFLWIGCIWIFPLWRLPERPSNWVDLNSSILLIQGIQSVGKYYCHYNSESLKKTSNWNVGCDTTWNLLC